MPETLSVGITTVWVGWPGARSTAVPGRAASPRSTARQGKLRPAAFLASTQPCSATQSTSRTGLAAMAAGITEKARRVATTRVPRMIRCSGPRPTL